MMRAVRRAARRLEIRIHHAFERRRLERFRGCHRGERCFVIGNGPSLRGQDLIPLAGEATFVTNHFYLHPAVEALRPTYYCSSDLSFFDHLIHPTWPDDLARLPPATVLFLPVELRRYIRSTRVRARPFVHYLRCDHTREIWRRGVMDVDATSVLATGDSVILDFCLPLAHFMGFAEVYLLGCDTDYQSPDGATHFYEARIPSRSIAYHRDVWQGNVTASYAIAGGVFAASGRRIYNATAGGRLEVFPRVRLAQVLDRSRPAPERP